MDRTIPFCDLAGLSDAQLLSRIAAQDREAFTAYFQRHHLRAYGLALRITRQPARAEEALQEAMLRVWCRAQTFQPRGCPEGWLLRIVARESVRIQRAGRRQESRAPLASLSAPFVWNREGSGDPSQAEGVHQLRLALDRLPVSDQRILALYFGAQLSQQEIGQALGLSQRSISRKVTLLLEQLRRRLRAAGARPEDPAQVGCLLADLLTRGAAPAPQGLEALWLRLAQGAPPEGRNGPWPSLGAPRLQPLVLGAGVALAALVVLARVEWPGVRGTPEEGLVAGEASPLPEEVPVQAWPAGSAHASPLAYQRWSFEEDDLFGRLPRFGAWDWGRGTRSGKGYLVSAPETQLLLPARIPAAPFELTVKYRLQGPELHCSLNLGWVSGRQGLPFCLISPGRAQGPGGPLLRSARFLGLGRHISGSYSGGIDYLYEYERPYPAEQLALALRGCAISELVLRPLPEGESQALAGKIRAFLARGGLGRQVLTDCRLGESGGRPAHRGTSPLLVEEGRP